MFTFERTVGRFCELRVEAGFSLRDMSTFRARLATLFQSGAGRVVICSDLTRCERVPADVVTALVAVGRIDNPMIERHGMLVVPTHALGAQMEVVVAEAGNPARRVFRSAAPLEAWLAEALTPPERARLAQFLAGMQ